MKNSVQNSLPLVSIVIPCRNEEGFIGQCLDTVIANDYPNDVLEILIVDGMSEDGTRKILQNYEKQYQFIRLLDNPERSTPCALNTGIKNAKGELIIRMDAHSIYEKDYISQCVHHLLNSDADNVGGICKVLPQNNSLIAESIAYAFPSPFAAGNSYYRIGTDKPRYVDTVFGGCYRKEVFDKIGYFDEELLRTQDSELNARLIKNGGKILLVPSIVSHYHTRRTLAEIWKMNLQYGISKPLAAKKVGKIYTLRQLVPALFVTGLVVPLILSVFSVWFLWVFLLVLASHTAASLWFSAKICVEKGFKYLPVLPLVFIVTHLGYGCGYIKGVWDSVILDKVKRKKPTDMPLTR